MVKTIPAPTAPGSHALTLERGERIPDPTKGREAYLYGPLKLVWTNFPSGIHVRILEGRGW